MSLVVWLPLDGDLRNLGASNVEVVNNGAVINNSGKIGSCYHFGTTTSFMTLPKEAMTSFTTECSVTFWLKIKTWNTSYATYFQAGLGSAPWAHYIFGFLRNSTNSTICFTISNGSSASNASYLTSTLELNKWYHIALTYKTGKCAIYLNGILDHEYSTSLVPAFSSITHITLGTCNSGTSYQTDCDMNDVRIYNHCLSAAEVHEIAMGLVLHYKLNNIMNLKNIAPTPIPNNGSYTTANYAWDSTKHPNAIIPTNWSGGYNSGVSNPEIGYHAMWNLIDNIPTIVFQNHNSEIGQKGRWLGVSCGLTENISANKQYIISYDQRTIDTLGQSTSSGIYYKTTSSSSNGFYDSCPEIGRNTVLNKWEHFSYTFTRSSNADGTGTAGSIYIYGHSSGIESTIQVRNVKIELIDSTSFIQDSSGYNHNGTITGTLTVSNDSPRYNHSSYMPKTTIITHTRPVYGGVDQEWTCMMWVKLDGTAQGYQQLNNFNSGNNIIHGANSYPLLYLNSGENDYYNYGNLAVSANTWTHIAFVFKNSNATKLIYINGINQTNTNGPNKTSTPSGISDTITVGNNLTGYISDYRIYCTALLDKDIKLLYNTSMRIDNLGEIHTYEFEENKNNLMWRPENARAAGLGLNWGEGLGAYTQSNCQVTCDSNGYRIYRPPNLTVADNGNTMWGGLKIVNSTNGNIHTYNGTTDNIFGLTKGHTYIIILTVKGKSGKTASSFGWTNQMGWGGGGLSPNPSNVIYKNIGNNFNGKTECYYKFTVSDDIVKTCTTTYSGFTSGNQYLSYRDFMFGFGYESTESLGTDLYIFNIRLFDLTNKTSKNIQKSGIIEFTQFIEKEENITKIRNDEELYATEFIEI